MNGRLKVIGVMLAVIGLAFIAAGGFAYYKTTREPSFRRSASRRTSP